MYSFVSVIANIPAPVELVIAQFTNQANIRFISQLTRGISRILRKLLKSFNDTAISTFFVLPAAGVLPVIFVLNLNDSETVILSLGYLLYCHRPHDIFPQLLLYSIRSLYSIWYHKIQVSCIIYWSIIYFVDAVSKWCIICATCSFLSLAFLAVASVPAQVIVMVPFTSMYTSLQAIWLDLPKYSLKQLL